MRSATDILQHPVKLLRPVTHPDGEYQERHQDREGIQFVTEGSEDTHLPHHRDKRNENHHHGGAETVCVQVQQQGGDDHSHCEESHYHQQAVDQIAHQLGEADDVDRFVRIILGKTIADLFQLFRQIGVVQALASLRIIIQ